jgi:hypothetical protein
MGHPLSLSTPPTYKPGTQLGPRFMVAHERDPTDSLLFTKPKATKKEIDADEELNTLVEKGTKCLYKVTAVFPFDLFPNQITVDVNQINIVIKEFFWSERRHSIHIKDIMDVFIDTSLLFSTIKIVDRGYADNGIEIKYLKTSEAIKLRRIIQGLIIAHRQQIDLANVDSENLVEKIEELGKVKDFE